MNLTQSDSLLGRQRSRQWSPLITQQFRLRHIHQITGLNFPHLPKNGSYYYTLHLTTMSAPFYTSSKTPTSNPKWPELDLRNLPNLGTPALVLRVWQHCATSADAVVTTWGVNLSGLVYLGGKVSDIQPCFFNSNTVIFNIRGGLFTTSNAVIAGAKPPPFLSNLNVVEIEGVKKLFRKVVVSCSKSEVRDSYNINKLRRLHSLQLTIRNKSLDVESVREKIQLRCGVNAPDSPEENPENSSLSKVRYAPQLLTMRSVNKMLEQKPTKMQRIEMEKKRNEIEIQHFRNKLLSQERDKKTALIRRRKLKLKDLIDENDRKNLSLMDDYHCLRRETTKLKDLLVQMLPNQQLLTTLYAQLCQRRRQLLQQLLFIYPIQQISERKFSIHGIHLPNSDILGDHADAGISVALGYITHILLMASTFLQVPLRYPVTHYGSRSSISDHVSPILPDREREFPLYTKGKEKIQFTYAVYLLNKDIAQLRWFLFMHTTELKATLPNLLSFLDGRDFKETPPLVVCSMNLKAELGQVDVSKFHECPKKYNKFLKICESGPGLSEILAIPEAFMNKQITSESFQNYAASKKTASIVIKEGVVSSKSCDSEAVEEGTDLLDPALDLAGLEGEEFEVKEGRGELLEKWMKNGSDCGSSDSVLQGDVQNNAESPLMARTDALLAKKSFNLVKPKSSL